MDADDVGADALEGEVLEVWIFDACLLVGCALAAGLGGTGLVALPTLLAAVGVALDLAAALEAGDVGFLLGITTCE